MIEIFYHTITSHPAKRMAVLFSFENQTDFEETLGVAFAFADAEITRRAFMARDERLWVSRQEFNPSNLIGFRVFDEDPWSFFGECGWLFIQTLDVEHTRISIKVHSPSRDEIEKYCTDHPVALSENERQLSFEEINVLKQTRTFERLVVGRQKVLSNFYAPISAKLTEQAQYQVKGSQLTAELSITPDSQPDASVDRPKLPGGRSKLSGDELVKRLALVLLERRLKQKDSGLTRGEFVVQVQEKMGIPLEPHTVKNAAKLLEQAQKNDELQLLSQADEMAAAWQTRFM